MNKTVKINEEQATNAAADIIEMEFPYIVDVTIEGSADILLHAWNNEAVAVKSKSRKGSKAKKTDDVESYVRRDAKGEVCVTGDYLRGSIINAAKFRQDPRSPRKSAMDLYKAAIISLTPLASFGAAKWDYEDKRRVIVHGSAITRVRPAMVAGWRLPFTFLCNLPEYVSPLELRETIEQAGRLVGIGDHRPTYGRFGIVAYELRPAA
jgi:hypothetical protein